MRPFRIFEIVRHKCYICGCKNKMMTDLMFDNRKVGYSLRCCNCGHTSEFLYDNDGEMEYLLKDVYPGLNWCIQPDFCPFKKCKLYDGTRRIFPPIKKEECPVKQEGSCGECNFCKNKKQDYCKLDVNTLMRPKFL